jgi:uncharacterized membrane protein YcaP (DUF421 family)
MFDAISDSHIFTIIWRTFFYYFGILLMYRIMGKREVGELGIIDLVVSVLIAQFATISIEDFKMPIINTIIPVALIVIFQIVLALISMKNMKFRNFIDGSPSIIIKDGKINFKEMTKQRYNLDDLLTQIRAQQIKSLEDVEYAVLETSGKLSIFQYDQNKKNYPMPLILDGEIQQDTLKDINKTENWVFKVLKEEKVNLENVFYAFYKGQKTFIIKKSDVNK